MFYIKLLSPLWVVDLVETHRLLRPVLYQLPDPVGPHQFTQPVIAGSLTWPNLWPVPWTCTTIHRGLCKVWHRCCTQERRRASTSRTMHGHHTYIPITSLQYDGYLASLATDAECRAGKAQLGACILCIPLYSTYLYAQQNQPRLSQWAHPGRHEGTAVAVKKYVSR